MPQYIAAPWREPYVRKANKSGGCIFCEAVKDAPGEESLVLHRGKTSFVILNRFPYNPGHLMIAPLEHLDDLDEAGSELAGELMALLRLSLRVLKKAYKPEGFNIGMNLGRSAGAGVADHFHLHIVPRWTGDANFMPLVGGTKVMLEDLGLTCRRLRPLFARSDEAACAQEPTVRPNTKNGPDISR